MPSPSQAKGYAAEAAAFEHLCRSGLTPVARNFRTRFGELDLIMRDADTLVFVEVRLRQNTHYGTGADSVTAAKQQRLRRAANIFLARHPKFNQNTLCRFDVVSVTAPNCRWSFHWIPHAFVDNGSSA